MLRFVASLALAITFCTSIFWTRPAVAWDVIREKSGLLLGVYASPNHGGMEVQRLIPGYPVDGQLLPGDVLLRATADGVTVHSLRSNEALENAKRDIGANRQVAAEILRPGHGLIYAWIEFTPAASLEAASSRQSKAMFRAESEPSGAQAMFSGSSGGSQQTVERPGPGFSEREVPREAMPFTERSSDRAAMLFQRR